jgi:nucleoside-diphosphate-sugar epimerase
MRILVIGGTQFVGRHFAAVAAEAGHDLTLLHRGRTGSDLFPQAEHLLLDRDGDLSPLAGRSFDATVDFCGYLPRQVTHLAEALDGRAGQYVFISSVSAYADPPAPGATEQSAELIELDDADEVTEVTNQTYGGLKVACERAAAAAYGGALTIVRPTYVVGPWDATGRFPWWVQRLARGGEVLAPGPADSPMQVIDARDQAAWLVSLLEAGVTGAFHAASPPPPFGMAELLERSAAAIAPAGTTLTWVEAGWLAAAGQDGMSLPLWSEGSREFALALDPAAAYATGLAPRPLEDTVRDTLAWVESSGDMTREGVGLDPQREAELLARWHAER